MDVAAPEAQTTATPAPVAERTPEIKMVEICGFSEALPKIKCPYCLHVLFFARLQPGTAFEIKCKHCKRFISLIMVSLN
ncbi:MAG: hypothetical protein KJ579_08530 [Verrucomicrobia bacterium]|nr:hypothetical protein [Verrucomicrobiota bacterium]